MTRTKKNRSRRASAILALLIGANSAPAFAQKPASPVTGDGTPGAIPKFTGAANVDDSALFENKFGQVGLGTTTPTSRLTVVGKVQSTQGGFVFPDGTLQASAGLTAAQAVTSLNGLRGDVTIKAGKNVTVTPSGNTVVIDLPNALTAIVHDDAFSGDGTAASPLRFVLPVLTSVAHDATLEGDGTAASPLRAVPTATTATVAHDGTLVGDGTAATPLAVKVPLTLTGGGTNTSALFVTNTGGSGDLATGATILAGDSGNGPGGEGVIVRGGGTGFGDGGPGIFATGGAGTGSGNVGGTGIVAIVGFNFSQATEGLAGKFIGDVQVTGTLDASGGSLTKIDHPLDPENKYLVRAAVVSAELLDVSSGNVTTDASGRAVVVLPEWFDAANADVRYQLTVVGETFARAIVSEKLRDDRFTIKTDAPNVEVSWQVTGVRADAASKRNAFAAEREKPARERGTYLDPEAFGAPAERGLANAERARAESRAGGGR